MEWSKVTDKTPKNSGTYITTLLHKTHGHRETSMCEYKDGRWVLPKAYDNNIWRVIAFIENIKSISPYNGRVQEFNKGDIIVWTRKDDETNTMLWMIISSFDYEADNAARAAIGKEFFYTTDACGTITHKWFTTYEDWVPNEFGNDVHIATEEEKEKVYKEIIKHYKTYGKKGYSLMETILKRKHYDIFTIIDNLWYKEENNL